jgi:short-subunit dehydrogenase
MMSSDSGFFATPFFGPYCSSKFALEGYSDSLRREVFLCGIKVVLIEPGRITTPIWDKGEILLQHFESPSDSPFSRLAQKVGEYAIRKGRTAGLNPIEVAKVVYVALTQDKPAVRYLVAAKKLKYRMVKILPASRVDAMVQKELLTLQKEDH